MLYYFAHAGELHDTAATATYHSLFSRWYVALIVLVLLVMVVGKITHFISRGSLSAVYVVIMSTLLVTGMLSYSLSSTMSIVAITVGFAMSMIQMIAGLTSDKPQEGKNGE